jgi:hypothetical protein
VFNLRSTLMRSAILTAIALPAFAHDLPNGPGIAPVATVTQQFSADTVLAQSSFDGGIDCSSFQRNSDGSWTVLQRAYFPTLYVWVNAGVTFIPGQTFMGNDLGGMLNQACGRQ